MLGNSRDRIATAPVEGVPLSTSKPISATIRNPSVLQILEICGPVKNMAEKTLALGRAIPVRICQNKEIRTLEDLNTSSHNTKQSWSMIRRSRKNNNKYTSEERAGRVVSAYRYQTRSKKVRR